MSAIAMKCIYLTVDFIQNTRARGCFILLQDVISGFTDEFRALSCPSEVTTYLATTIDNVPHSVYRVFAYVLELDGQLVGALHVMNRATLLIYLGKQKVRTLLWKQQVRMCYVKLLSNHSIPFF